jgi:RHS repeat-associated protein
LKSRFSKDRVPATLTHGWDENSIKYDVNGNIQALRRDSSVQGTLANGVLIDQLKYSYSAGIPDQLYTVYDSSASAKGFIGGATGSHYNYDANGNLTNEPYQGITGITYNVLNRTDSTKISGSTYITYTYNAAGMLLRKKAYNSGTLTQTDYIGGFVYIQVTVPHKPWPMVPMPEGRLIGATLTQEYVITDPQGNARVAFQNVSGVAKVTQENSYYGYGLLMPGSLVGWSVPRNKNLYNGGSEWQNDTKAVNAGVPNYYQTFYRNYDPALARWVAVDPMAEGAESMSVFQYAGDNPIMGNDPGGDLAAVKNNLPPPVNNTFLPYVEGGGGLTDWVENQEDQQISSEYQAYQQGLASTPGSDEQLEAQQARSEADMATPGSTSMALEAGLFAFNVQNNTANSTATTTVEITPTGITISSNRYVSEQNVDYVAPPTGQIPNMPQNEMRLITATVFFSIDANQGGDQTASLDKFNTGAGAFGFGWGAKDALIDYAKSTGGSLEGLAGYAKVVKGVAFAGNVLNAGIVVTKVLVNRQIMPSDILDGVAAGASFIPGFGWAIGGVYFLGDIATKSLTGESIGQHLNDYYGDKPVVSW